MCLSLFIIHFLVLDDWHLLLHVNWLAVGLWVLGLPSLLELLGRLGPFCLLELLELPGMLFKGPFCLLAPLVPVGLLGFHQRLWKHLGLLGLLGFELEHLFLCYSGIMMGLFNLLLGFPCPCLNLDAVLTSAVDLTLGADEEFHRAFKVQRDISEIRRMGRLPLVLG